MIDRDRQRYIRLFPLLEPPPFVSAFVFAWILLTVTLFDLIGDSGGLDEFELPSARTGLLMLIGGWVKEMIDIIVEVRRIGIVQKYLRSGTKV